MPKLTIELSPDEDAELRKAAAELRVTPERLAVVVLTCPPLPELLLDSANLSGIIKQLARRYPVHRKPDAKV